MNLHCWSLMINIPYHFDNYHSAADPLQKEQDGSRLSIRPKQFMLINKGVHALRVELKPF